MFTARTTLPLTLSLIVVGLVFGNALPPVAAQTADQTSNTMPILHGQASKKDFLAPKNQPALSRTDLDRAGDSFKHALGGGGLTAAPLIDAPSGAFADTALLPPPIVTGKSFGLSVGQEDFNGQDAHGKFDHANSGSLPLQHLQPGVPSNDNANAGNLRPGEPVQDSDIVTGQPGAMGTGGQGVQDPDNSRAMQIAWDAWHKRIATAIFERFNGPATTMFGNAPPTRVGLNYVVTRDGQIKDMRIVRSPNVMFNSFVVQVVKSLNGEAALLQFPEGSRRMSVFKEAVFYTPTPGIPQGAMRYTTGDRETFNLQ